MMKFKGVKMLMGLFKKEKLPPCFINNQDYTLILPIPSGGSISVKPGKMILGQYYARFVDSKKLSIYPKGERKLALDPLGVLEGEPEYQRKPELQSITVTSAAELEEKKIEKESSVTEVDIDSLSEKVKAMDRDQLKKFIAESDVEFLIKLPSRRLIKAGKKFNIEVTGSKKDMIHQLKAGIAGN